jgi:hypothetical protein
MLTPAEGDRDGFGFRIGKAIAVTPAEQSCDVGYHLAHRRKGYPLDSG